MSAAIKRITLVPDSAAAELWRVAESGDPDELSRVLMRVSDVNARNKHGMTALMKAAYYGHEEVVRVLLDHGADPNLSRNDKFTALALAAFFGHTETVRTLLERGARAEVLTRCGASACMWAKARTFVDAAQYLESKVPAPVAAPAPIAAAARVAASAPVGDPAPIPVPAPIPAPVLSRDPAPAAPIVVKTLKDPPEIWDLVHEVRPSFSAGTAFVTRLKSNRVLALGLFAALVLAVAGGGVLLFRGSKATTLRRAEIPLNPSVQNDAQPQAQRVETSVTVSEAEPDVIESNHPRKVTPKVRARSSAHDSFAESVQPKEEAPPAAVVAPVAPSPKVTAAEPPAKKANNTLSPQLIAPAKNEAAPKAKVIQWP